MLNLKKSFDYLMGNHKTAELLQLSEEKSGLKSRQ